MSFTCSLINCFGLVGETGLSTLGEIFYSLVGELVSLMLVLFKVT